MTPTTEKIIWLVAKLLENKYNLFHSDMICRAMFDTEISLDDFKRGVEKIGYMEAQEDSDEYTPIEFEKV